MNTTVYILGAGGHAQQVIDVFEELNYTIKGIFDDIYPNKHHICNGKYMIIDKIENIQNHIEQDCNVFCAIGDNFIREQLYTKLINYNFNFNFNFNFTFINCISPHARISKNIDIGIGNYIGHNVVISGGTKIGSHNILNEGCILPHDCNIGNFNHISIGVVCGGNVIIGNNNLLGLNCTILPKITIGNNNLIGAGSVIIRTISNNSKYCGNPGKLLDSIKTELN